MRRAAAIGCASSGWNRIRVRGVYGVGGFARSADALAREWWRANTVAFELTARNRAADPDDHLVIRAREGDDGAFDELVQRYADRLYRFVYRMLQDAADSEDVLQTTLLRAYGALGSYRPGGHFASWIYRIALNECRRRLRARGRLPTLPEDVALKRPAGMATDPEACALQQERNRRLRNAVMRLPQHYREAILLFYFEDMSVEQMARAAGISVTAAKVRLHRAREKLSIELDGLL